MRPGQKPVSNREVRRLAVRLREEIKTTAEALRVEAREIANEEIDKRGRAS
jgi:hypothetical protein